MPNQNNHQEFDLDGQHASKAYNILASLVTPRPIAWITTIDENGIVNAAPFSFFNVFGSNPPIVAIAPGNKSPGIPKDTAKNIRSNHELVINLVDETVVDQMVQTAATFPHGQSEIENTDLTLTPSTLVKPPRITQAPAALECREHSTLEIGTNRIIIATVHRVHTRDQIFHPETANLNQHAYNPIGRMASPDWYTLTKDLFEKPRPK